MRILTVLVLFSLAFQPVAHAEGLRPLPELGPAFDLNAYAASTDTLTKSFPDIPHVSFEISLPKTWVERTTLGQSYGELLRYEGPAFGDVRPYFSFSRHKVLRENSAKHELIAFLLQRAYVLRSLKDQDDRNVEAMYVLVDNKGDEYAVRAQVRILGHDMLIAEYAVPVRAWETEVDAQTFAMKSFKFLKDTQDTIEKRIERSYFRSLRFYYPASWVFVKEVPMADNEVRLVLSNKDDNGNEAGQIVVTAMSNKSLKDEFGKKVFGVDVPAAIKAVRKTYEDRMFVFGDTIENRKPELNLPASFSALNAYRLHVRKGQFDTDTLGSATHELWIAVFKTKDDIRERTFIVELFTPSRQRDPYMWAVNTRAFEILLKSMQ